jgi:putative ABC transport system ATP-binding protein
MEIRISQLAFEYPNRSFRLRVPELRIESGAAAAFVGPSGSGKSTLLRLLAGIHVPAAGELWLDAMELPRLSDAERRRFRLSQLGFVFQDFQLIEYLDVRENIRLPYRLGYGEGWTASDAERLEDLAGVTGIAGKLSASIDELSHGEKQRVAICRALITRPRLVLADEPTGNLDPANKRRIVDLLFGEAGRCGSTLVMVTHDRELLAGFGCVIDFQAFHSP